MRTDNQLILATKPFAKDQTLRSWCHVLSTGALLLASREAMVNAAKYAGDVPISLFACKRPLAASTFTGMQKITRMEKTLRLRQDLEFLSRLMNFVRMPLKAAEIMNSKNLIH